MKRASRSKHGDPRQRRWWWQRYRPRHARPELPPEPPPSEPIRSTFGEPFTLGEFIDLDALPDRARRLQELAAKDYSVTQTLNRLREQLDRDLAFMLATRRWRPGLPDPATFVPGDVVVLRALAAKPLVWGAVTACNALGIASVDTATWSPADDPEGTYRLINVMRSCAATAAWTLEAAPYFLPVTAAVGVMASHPPDPDLLAAIRLPFAIVTVYFGADLAIDERFLRWSDALDSPERRQPWQLAARLTGQAVPSDIDSDLSAAVRDLGGYLTGVTLFANEQGGIADDVEFIVATNPDPNAPGSAALDRGRGVIPGRLSRSTLHPLVANLAAAVSWGAWSNPTANAVPPAVPGSRAWRKAITSSRYRRDEERGAFAGVRILDTVRTAAAARASQPDDDTPTRPSPATHLRRGHWRRVRIGPRNDWHYEGRWIAPTVVSPGGQPVGGEAVYRLPVPDAARAALGVDPDDPTGIPAT